MKHAVYELAQFKALPDADGEERGRFEAIVSVFGNVDKMGDRVVEGAFTNTLAEWRASGKRLPVIWSHQWGNPDAHIGDADPNLAEEVPGKGLKIVGDVDLDERFSAKVYKLMKRGLQFSFAYEVIKEKKAQDGANELLELKLIEVGPTLVGANPATELLAIKAELEDAAGLKAGRSISAKTESLLRDAVKANEMVWVALNEILGSLGDPEEENKDGGTGTVKTDAGIVDAVELLELQAQIQEVKNHESIG